MVSDELVMMKPWQRGAHMHLAACCQVGCGVVWLPLREQEVWWDSGNNEKGDKGETSMVGLTAKCIAIASQQVANE